MRVPRWLPLVGTMAALLVGCRSACELDAAEEDVAGAGATDCGRVALGGDQTASRRCAVEAVRAGRAFRVAWQQQGTDSVVWTGFARAPDGTAYAFGWDSDPSGGSDLGARTQRTRCASLEVATRDGAEDVNCVPGGPLATVCR